MPQPNFMRISNKFKYNNELTNKSQIVYNTRGRIKKRRFRRGTASSTAKQEQARLNNQPDDTSDLEDEASLKCTSNSRFAWKTRPFNEDFFTPSELFADQINPSISYPLCILESPSTQNNTKYPILFVRRKSLENLISGLLGQLSQVSDALFCDFDWEKISNSCGLSSRACREIWWSIDDSIIPVLDGYLITLDLKYYKNIDPKLILQCKIGDFLRVGVVNHSHGLALVKTIGNDSITIELERPFHLIKNENPLPVLDAAFVIPRPKAIDRSIQIAVTIGVGKFSLICTDNVERSYLSSSHLTKSSVESCIIKGLEQCMDTRCPAVDLIKSWPQFIHNGQDNLSHVVTHQSGPVLLVIGPERGWTANEIDDFKDLNSKILSLGPRILTCSTALAVSLGLFTNLLNNYSIRNGLHPANRNAHIIPGNLIN